MEIIYNNKPIHYNEFLSPSLTRNAPIIKINDLGYKYYTLIMYDPDAIKGTYWHWILSNIVSSDDNNLYLKNAILDYYGPNPPDKKKHHYIFELYGSQEKIPMIHFESRVVDLNKGKDMLHLKGEPILRSQFLSQREKGGTKKRSVKKKRKTRKTKLL